MESIDHNKMLVEAYIIGCFRGGSYKLDESEYTPIMKILDARINWVNESLQSAILIDPYLFLYLSVASNENPGIAIIMLYTILQKLKEHGHDINGARIDVNDLVEIYPDHLIGDNDKDIWDKLWDQQKDENGRNQVDQLDYWKLLLD